MSEQNTEESSLENVQTNVPNVTEATNNEDNDPSNSKPTDVEIKEDDVVVKEDDAETPQPATQKLEVTLRVKTPEPKPDPITPWTKKAPATLTAPPTPPPPTVVDPIVDKVWGNKIPIIAPAALRNVKYVYQNAIKLGEIRKKKKRLNDQMRFTAWVTEKLKKGNIHTLQAIARFMVAAENEQRIRKQKKEINQLALEEATIIDNIKLETEKPIVTREFLHNTIGPMRGVRYIAPIKDEDVELDEDSASAFVPRRPLDPQRYRAPAKTSLYEEKPMDTSADFDDQIQELGEETLGHGMSEYKKIKSVHKPPPPKPDPNGKDNSNTGSKENGKPIGEKKKIKLTPEQEHEITEVSKYLVDIKFKLDDYPFKEDIGPEEYLDELNRIKNWYTADVKDNIAAAIKYKFEEDELNWKNLQKNTGILNPKAKGTKFEDQSKAFKSVWKSLQAAHKNQDRKKRHEAMKLVISGKERILAQVFDAY